MNRELVYVCLISPHIPLRIETDILQPKSSLFPKNSVQLLQTPPDRLSSTV